MTEFDTFQPCLDALAYDLLLNPVIVDFTFTVPRKQRRRPFISAMLREPFAPRKQPGSRRVSSSRRSKLILVPVTTGDMLRSDDDDDIIARLA